MLQSIGICTLLGFMALIQMTWSPGLLPGLQGPPLLVLVTGVLVLWFAPRLTFYWMLAFVVLLMDLLIGEGILTVLATLATAQIPLAQPGKQKSFTFLRCLAMLVGSILVFEMLLGLYFGLRYTGAGVLFWQGLLPSLGWNTLLGMMLYAPIRFVLNLLHYQESHYLEDAMRGNLG